MAVAAELAVDGNSTSFVLAWERGGFRVLQEAGSRSSGPSPASPLADGGITYGPYTLGRGLVVDGILIEHNNSSIMYYIRRSCHFGL